MPFLRQGAVSAPIVIPAAQSIRVAALNGSTASVNIPTGLPGGPVGTVIDGSVLFGPFPAGAAVVVSCIIGECEFVIGATPVLTDTLYNSAGVAITGGAVNGTTIGATTPSTLAVTTLTATAAVALSPANANVIISPTGTGVVTINPATLGTINNASIGATTPSTVSATASRMTSLLSALTDSSGTPGNVTNNATHGRAAFAATGTAVVVTNSSVAANSTVLVILGGADATLTSVRVTPGAGSFTITGNAAATGITPFNFLVIGN